MTKAANASARFGTAIPLRLSGRLGIWLLGSALALLAMGLAHWTSAPAFRQLEDRVADGLWRLSASHAPERRLVIVDIDEASLREQGRWPWPRDVQARLMDRLAAAGVRQQVWDVFFPGDSAGPTPDKQAAADRALVRAVAQHQPVLAQIFDISNRPAGVSASTGPQADGVPAGAVPTLAAASGAEGAACGNPWPVAGGYMANRAELAAVPGVAVGHITPRLDADGVLRQQPAVVCHEGRAYPSLSLAALMQSLGGAAAGGAAVPTLQRGGLWEAPWQLQWAAGVLPPVPLDVRGDVRIPWRQHPEGYISLSAADVLAGRVPAGLLQGAWVLVGGTAFSLNDRIATPHQAAAPGLVAHAQLITALLDGRVPAQPRGAPLLQAGAVALGLLLLGGLLMGRQRLQAWLRGTRTHHSGSATAWVPLAALGAVPALLAGHAALLLGAGLWVGWALPALGLLVAGTSMGALAHARSRVDRDRLYRHLSSYLPAPVAAALAGQGPSGRIVASSRQVSVMFADIRNFSAYCEARPPEEAAAVLHAFFASASRIVQAHGGVVEALQGDSVVATWGAEADGAPADATAAESSHAARALAAARELQAAMGGVLPDPAPAGLEPLALGIGLETGPAMTGSIGPQERRTHMVMGRTVTIASRLVGMTAELAHPVLVGEGMAAQLGGHLGGQRLQSLGTFMLDGLRVPHHIYAWPMAAVGGGLGAGSTATTLQANMVAQAATLPEAELSALPVDLDSAPSRQIH